MRWSLFVLALAGCGRIGFGGTADARGDVAGDGTDAPPVPVPRHWVERPFHEPGRVTGMRMVFEPTRGTVVVHGGDLALSVPGAPVESMWALSPTGWTLICDVCGPSARLAAAMIYDPDRSRIVLFGGDTPSGNLDDLWTFAGGAWTAQTATGTPPSGRHNAHFVRDPVRKQILMFGGETNGAIETADVFELVGQTWTRRTPSGGPTSIAGQGQAAVWDPSGQRILALEGGQTPTDAVWAYDGSQWTRLCSSCTGTPRIDATLVADQTTVYLIGGYTGGSELAETWVLSGDQFTLRANAPSARDSVAAAYDPIRDVIVMYGGNGDGCAGMGNCDETWELVPD